MQTGNLVVNNLKTIGISKLDYVVGTHPHEDHIGGLDNVINAFKIGKVMMPKTSTNTKTYEEEVRAWTTEVQTWVAFTNVNPSLKQNDSKLVKRLNYLAKLYTKDGNQNTSIANLIANQPAYASLKRS